VQSSSTIQYGLYGSLLYRGWRITWGTKHKSRQMYVGQAFQRPRWRDQDLGGKKQTRSMPIDYLISSHFFSTNFQINYFTSRLIIGIIFFEQ
jgi:hypothetical protein